MDKSVALMGEMWEHSVKWCQNPYETVTILNFLDVKHQNHP